MLTAFIAFVNAHFSALIAGVAAESSIVSLVYGIIMNDMIFAVGMAIVVCFLGFIMTRIVAAYEPKGGEVTNM